jgi:calpain, invertebrate
LQRKLQILDGEMCETTSYSSEDTAAMYAFYKPTQGPFVIVPSLLKDDKQADFSLTGKNPNL